ncbi:MAG: NAD(P)H-hydrate dehydratase [Chthoniobacterales bacterium]
MTVLSIRQMIELETRAFASGVDAWELMQEAGRQMACAIRQRFPQPGFCRVFAGKGNNAGDAWVVARLLDEAGWKVEVECPFPIGEMSPLARRAIEGWTGRKSSAETTPPNRRPPFIVVDGLLGIGAQGEVRPPLREMIHEIARQRAQGAVVFSLDLPSGLGTETCVVADHTLTVGFAKDVLLADAAAHFVGRISVLPLEELSSRVTDESADELATAATLRSVLPPRSFDIHKGECGRVMLVAGSLGTAGAAVLAAHGALRAGAGLVSLVCPPEIYPTLAPMLPPEVMARPWDQMGETKMDVLAIGPGLDPKWRDAIWPLIESAPIGQPLVLDAGALTILAEDISRLEKLPGPILLTPHPGEMERLFPRQNRTRAQWAADCLSTHGNVTLLLKGSRTLVAQRDWPASYNSTGHPGMATGGMGDTLTGVCAALLGQKLSTRDAARVGAWVCGRAAEIAVEESGQSQESLLPSDLHSTLGRAFSDLRAGVY